MLQLTKVKKAHFAKVKMHYDLIFKILLKIS